MIIVADEDKYITTTWGASIRLEAGVPKEVGNDIALLALQQGCTEVKGIKETPIKEEAPIEEAPIEEAPVGEASIDLDSMTKIQLEEYGRTIGIELDRRKKKAALIEELKAAE
tara:strand:- start:2584 stop:2922 length:339 start_codon:yes stop_codon:yes gene_type:complete